MSDPYKNDRTPWRDRSRLERLYVAQGMNTYEIADELGTTHVTVSDWLEKFGFRAKREINKDRPWRDEEAVRELYEGRMLTISELANELSCSYSTAHSWLKKHRIERRGHVEESHRTHLNQPARFRTTREGYEVVESTLHNKTDVVRVHRLVAVAEHGLETVEGDHIHHKNGIPWDNRPENLEVVGASEHARIHKPVEVRWGSRTPSDAFAASENGPGGDRGLPDTPGAGDR